MPALKQLKEGSQHALYMYPDTKETEEVSYVSICGEKKRTLLSRTHGRAQKSGDLGLSLEG